MRSTSVPLMWSWRAISSAEPSAWTSSLSHDSGARIVGMSDRLQVAKVVLVEQPDIGRAREEHRQPLDPAAEREPVVLRRVVADATQGVGMDHPAAGRLDPAGAGAGRAAPAVARTGAVAHEAVERDLRRRLGEWEVVRTEADLPLAAEQLAGEAVEHTLQIGHRHLLVDR